MLFGRLTTILFQGIHSFERFLTHMGTEVTSWKYTLGSFTMFYKVYSVIGGIILDDLLRC